MAQEKQLTKKDIQELLEGQTEAILNVVDEKLGGQTKAILKAVDKKIDTKIDGLAILMNNAFQTNQEYMDKNFQGIRNNFSRVDENFKKVTQQINKINLNAVDVVRQDEFEKIEHRVEKLEGITGLMPKRA